MCAQLIWPTGSSCKFRIIWAQTLIVSYIQPSPDFAGIQHTGFSQEGHYHTKRGVVIPCVAQNFPIALHHFRESRPQVSPTTTSTSAPGVTKLACIQHRRCHPPGGPAMGCRPPAMSSSGVLPGVGPHGWCVPSLSPSFMSQRRQRVTLSVCLWT